VLVGVGVGVLVGVGVGVGVLVDVGVGVGVLVDVGVGVEFETVQIANSADTSPFKPPGPVKL
jgi:hypothetical protein